MSRPQRRFARLALGLGAGLWFAPHAADATTTATATPSPAATPIATAAPPSVTPAAAPATASAPAAAPAPKPSVDPAIAARAKNWLHRAQTGDIDRGQLDDKMKALLTPAFAKQIAAQMGSLGEPAAFEYVETKTFPPNTLYAFKVTFGSDTLYWLFSTNPMGKITGFRLVSPPQ